MTCNNSSEKDEELLKKLFPELVDHGNHGIDSHGQGQDEFLKIIL